MVPCHSCYLVMVVIFIGLGRTKRWEGRGGLIVIIYHMRKKRGQATKGGVNFYRGGG